MKQSLQEWFDQHATCGFSGVDAAHGWGTSTVEHEYFDGSYQICLAGGIVWVANGNESIACELSDLSDRFSEFEVIEIRANLGL